MRKEKIALFPLIIGLILIFSSWYISYPIAVDSPFDFLPNHISPLFWLGLSMVCAALYIMAMLSKRQSLKCIATLGIVMFIYSTAYFFWFIPGTDSHYFRGLTEYFIETGDLSFVNPYHSYYQWPLFFVLNKMAHVMGLSLRCFEFILFGLFGIIYAASLYFLFHKSSEDGAYVAVLSYFIIMWWYIDYQFVPFSLAFGFLLILFMLDNSENKNPAKTFLMLVLFVSMALTHSFVPVFFISYVFLKYILSRDRKYVSLFLMSLIIYAIVLTFRAVIFLAMSIEELLGFSSDVYARFAQTIFIEATTPLHELAQIIGRAIFIITSLVSGIGFVILLFKRKLGTTNLALLISGAAYAIASAILPILGVRAFAIMGVPLSLGVIYFQKTKFRRLFQYLFLVVIILFAFLPLHSSFSLTRSQIPFQTKEEYQAANFLIDNYHPNEESLMGTDFRTMWYLTTKMHTPNVTFEDVSFFNNDPDDYNCILYTIGLEKNFLSNNYTIAGIIQEMNEYNAIYSSGSSQIMIKR